MCQNVVEDNIRQLRQKDDEIREALTKVESSEEVNIDDVIQPSVPLYKQSVNSDAFCADFRPEQLFMCKLAGQKPTHLGKSPTHSRHFAQMGKLIIRKIIKIAAIRCHILKLKCTKFDFSWGSTPDPTGELTALP